MRQMAVSSVKSALNNIPLSKTDDFSQRSLNIDLLEE
jgi:hypothetical protein